MCGELIHFALGEFEPLVTANFDEKPLGYCYDIKLNIGIELMQLQSQIRESTQATLNFLHPLEVDLSPEKLRLNLDWKSLLGSYKLTRNEMDFLNSIYCITLIPNSSKPVTLLEPLFLDKEYSFLDSLCPIPILESELNSNKIIVSALNHKSSWKSQEMTPLKLPLKRHSIAIMNNLIFPSPKKQKQEFNKQDIFSDGLLSDTLEYALCYNNKYTSAADIVTSLQRQLITAPYSPFEHWKFTLPNMVQPHQPSLVESLSFTFLIFSDREHLLSWIHPIFNNFNIAMDLMPFEAMPSIYEAEQPSYIYPTDNDPIEMLFNKLNAPQEIKEILVLPKIESSSICKTLKVGISALINSVFGISVDKVVEIKQKSASRKVAEPSPELPTEMKFIKSSATIVVNPTMLQDKSLVKVIQSTCSEIVEMGGQMELAKCMPTLIVDENVAIVIINGFLFTQTNEINENIGQMQLHFILRRNIQKFQRIYIFSLQYTMMGTEVIPSPIPMDDTIFINNSICLPPHCKLQMIFSPQKLGLQLISIFDRQSMILNRIQFYPLDQRTAFLVNLPTLNYIHSCCVQSRFNSLFEFIESDDQDFKSSSYEQAKVFMRENFSK